MYAPKVVQMYAPKVVLTKLYNLLLDHVLCFGKALNYELKIWTITVIRKINFAS